MKFLQVGAHIGNDDAFNIIKNQSIEFGLLVEPLPHLIPKLRDAYKDIQNIEILNKAISVKTSDSISFYYDIKDPITELGSMDREHLIKHKIDPNNIKEIQIPTETLNSLFERYNITELDYLFIDAEGFDCDILLSIDFHNIKVQNIIFEDIHSDGVGHRGVKFDNVVKKLQAEGYVIEKLNHNNTICTLQTNIHVLYRTSDVGYNKVKPSYVNNYNCLRNAISMFPTHKINWSIIADNTSEQTNNDILTLANDVDIKHVSVGHGAGTFNLALDYALTLPDNDIVYFLENDYIHRHGSYQAIISAINQLNPSFVSLYDHPDKYMDPSTGGNSFCEGGAEDTRVYLANNIHWKITNSTTMTFAATVKTLKRVESILRKWTTGSHPHDYEMFIDLRNQGELLITPIPGYSTHGETQWLAPSIKWDETINL